jgi:hypothetical protein
MPSASSISRMHRIYRDGLVYRVMFIGLDVTQVRQLAEEVQKKEEENRSMLDRVAQTAGATGRSQGRTRSLVLGSDCRWRSPAGPDRR